MSTLVLRGFLMYDPVTLRSFYTMTNLFDVALPSRFHSFSLNNSGTSMKKVDVFLIRAV